MRKLFQLLLETIPLLLLQSILVYFLLLLQLLLRVFELTSVYWFLSVWLVKVWHQNLKLIGSLRSSARVQLSAGSFQILHLQTWGISTKQREVSGRSSNTGENAEKEKKKKKHQGQLLQQRLNIQVQIQRISKQEMCQSRGLLLIYESGCLGNRVRRQKVFTEQNKKITIQTRNNFYRLLHCSKKRKTRCRLVISQPG